MVTYCRILRQKDESGIKLDCVSLKFILHGQKCMKSVSDHRLRHDNPCDVLDWRNLISV